MRIALADDSTLFRHGLALLLASAGDEITHQAASGRELIERIGVDPPDAAIVDIRMPPTYTTEGIDTAHRLRERHPDLAVLVLSTYVQTSYAIRLLEHGEERIGYLLKDHVHDVVALRDALDRLVAGETFVDTEIVTALMARRARLQLINQLTQREQDVLHLMAEGRSNAGISSTLFLSPKTVESYIANLFSKLDLVPVGVDNRRVLAVLTWLRTVGADEN